jgi:hypothetical protein
MKFVIALLLITDTVDYKILKDYSFKSMQECVEFQRYMNAGQPPQSRAVFWCVKVKK